MEDVVTAIERWVGSIGWGMCSGRHVKIPQDAGGMEKSRAGERKDTLTCSKCGWF